MKIITSLHAPELATALQDGKIGVMPSDTLYGLVCRAADHQAVERLYALKSRVKKPGTVIAATTAQLTKLGIPARYLKAVDYLWPNPLSIIVPTAPELYYLDGGKGLAVRIPAHPELIALLEKTGPLMTTSANLPGDPPANTVTAAQQVFGPKVDFYVDGGDLSNNQATTVIRIIDDEIVVLRQGAVHFDENGSIVT